MLPWKPARIGQSVHDLDTPALVLRLDAFERNLERMTRAVSASGMRLRPHAKSHKCPTIAHRQIQSGAVGICCQKVSEAAVFAASGVRDILITNQIVGKEKLARLAETAGKARIGVLVDHPAHVVALIETAKERDVRLDVYVEVDVGGGRCGVAPRDAGALAQRIADSGVLRFAGLHCYHGTAQHVRRSGDRAAAIRDASGQALLARTDVESRGMNVEIVTGAGTGTFVHERDSGIYNELQPGSYIFMDRDYGDNEYGDGDIRFEHALFVLATVTSRPAPGRAVIDAGLKASSMDSGMPGIWRAKGMRYLSASDEHGVLALEPDIAADIGDRLALVPGHCDPTVNLYDHLICVRDDVVQDVWPIEARGALR